MTICCVSLANENPADSNTNNVTTEVSSLENIIEQILQPREGTINDIHDCQIIYANA